LRILANENFPGAAVSALRDRGHDVVWVRTESPGISDQDVLALAQSTARLLVTFDKDFGELAFRHGLPSTCGIVLFRIAAPTPDRVATVAATALESRDNWQGHFSVVEDARIRMTPLP
jgi:predicted nuclease of predicted toxin-antitoxin system